MTSIARLALSALRGIAAFLLLTGSLLFVSAQQHPNGGYASHCIITGASLHDSHWLGCNCLNDDVAIFGYNYTWLDLNFCVGNRNGALESYDSGNYTTTCRNCRIYNNFHTIFLNCLCPDMAHVLRNSTLDLSKCHHPSGNLWSFETGSRFLPFQRQTLPCTTWMDVRVAITTWVISHGMAPLLRRQTTVCCQTHCFDYL
ncbi:hypothetical protein SMAC4_13074 [Sordaria macrospora]|uniref:uncharacterized protein n=1 Tax=Sordaria macrospora TaxID=5147 RepID=UPI002B2FAE54|nr:hypothetical protein SMAC4_13074 [Sordaria macrospora]